jgi:glc operon protein GlcG
MDILTVDRVRELLNRAAEKIAGDYKRPACVAITDENGFLLGFLRMDGAPVRSIQISQSKAYTAIRLGVPTDVFLERLRKDNLDIQYFCDPQLTALPGGNPLKNRDGRIIGAAGVSGLAPSEDQTITEDLARFVGL